LIPIKITILVVSVVNVYEQLINTINIIILTYFEKIKKCVDKKKNVGCKKRTNSCQYFFSISINTLFCPLLSQFFNYDNIFKDIQYFLGSKKARIRKICCLDNLIRTFLQIQNKIKTV
jgi:hypothetical protein